MIDFVLVNSLAFGICDQMEIGEQQEKFDLTDHNNNNVYLFKVQYPNKFNRLYI